MHTNIVFTIVNHPPVVTCEQAAIARGIKLKQELKTILLEINQRQIAVHVRGCDRIHFRRIKKLFRCENIRFLSEQDLGLYQLKAGIINPWNIPFCNYHLVCLNVFQNRFLATNNAKTTEGQLFTNRHIYNLPNLILGHFSYEH